MDLRYDPRRGATTCAMLALAALISALFVAAPVATRSAEASTPKPILVATTIDVDNNGGVLNADRLPGVNVEVYVNGTSTTTGTTTKTDAGDNTNPAFTDSFGTAVNTDTLIVCVDTPALHTFNRIVVNNSPIADPDNNGRTCTRVSSAAITNSINAVAIVFDYAPDKDILVATTTDVDTSGSPFLADRLPGVNVEVYVNGTSTTTGTTTKTAAGDTTHPDFTDSFGTAKPTDTLIVCVDTPPAHTFNRIAVSNNPTADPDNNGRTCTEIVPAAIAAVSVVTIVFDYNPDKLILVATTTDVDTSGSPFLADRLPGVNVEVYVNGTSTTTGATTKTTPGDTTHPDFTDSFGTAKDTDTLIVCVDTPSAHTFNRIAVNNNPTADPDNDGRNCSEIVPAAIANVSVVTIVFDYNPDKDIVVATTIDADNNGGPFNADRLPGVNVEVYVNGTSTTTGATTKTTPGATNNPDFTDSFGTAKDTDDLVVCVDTPPGHTFNRIVVNSNPIADPDNNGRTCTNVVPAAVANVSVVTIVFDYLVNPPTPPLFVKEFDPEFALPGSTTTATYTIDNRANLTATSFSFLDPPPPPLVGNEASINSDCSNVSLDPGWKLVGTAPLGDECTITVDVTAPATPGEYQTTTSVVTTAKGTTAAFSATLTVISPEPLSFSKDFGPNAIANGATSALTFAIENPNPTPIGDLGFVDNFPAGLTVATGATSNSCGGTLTAVPGSDLVKLANAAVSAKGTCTVTVRVTAAIGTYTNVTDQLTSELGAGATAADTLRVLQPVNFAKLFTPDEILDTETSTLRFSIANPNAVTVTSVGFTDVLPAGMSVANPAGLTTTQCVAGTIAATAGTTNITVAGVRVLAGNTCVIEVDVVAAAGTYQNTVSGFTSTAGTAPPAVATLTVIPTCQGEAVTHDMNVLGVNVLTTTGADDVILGTPNADIINARGGNDLVCAGDGDDTVNGEGGDDEIYGEGGDDEIRGGNGQDELRGGGDDDEIHGDDGADIIRGGSGRDKAYGGDGDDDIAGGSENDRLEGGPGDDEIEGDEGKDRIHGDEGNDVIRGGDGDDKLYGNADDDEIHGDDGDDRVNGGHDNDVLHGGDGDDNLRGRGGADEVNGNAGDDSLRGETGDDVLRGGGGDDNLRAEGGDDDLDGGNDTDNCNGGNHRSGDRYRASRCETISKVEIPY